MKAAVSSLLLVAVLLSGCGSSEPAPATGTATPAPPPAAGPASAPAPAAPPAPAAATESAPQDSEPAQTGEAAAADEPAADTGGVTATTAVTAIAEVPPSGPAPREGIDFTVIDPPAPLSPVPGRIEVAEVFSYTCIHCANIQAKVTPWKAKLPADVEFRYVPMAYGAVEPLARAFYAAQAMGELDRVHEKLFQSIAVQHKLKRGTAEEITALYADLGIDREALTATMSSFAVNAQITRNQKAVERWAIEGTPTFIVNGRYKVKVTQDRGHDGALSAVEHLVARERARIAGTAGAQ